MHRVGVWFVRRFFQDALQGEAVVIGRHLVAEAAREVGERGQLVWVRVGVDAAQKRHVEAGEMLRDSLVRRQHELFDDLMADVVLEEVGSG